jgi:hypothetical protein
VPFSPEGEPTISRTPAPGMQNLLQQLGQSDGADLTMGLRHGGTAARNGEPFGELAMVIMGDAAWTAQHGAPRDPMVHGSGGRDVSRSAGMKPIESPGTDPPAPSAAAFGTPTNPTVSKPATPSFQLPAYINAGHPEAVPVVIAATPGLTVSYSISDGTHAVTGSSTVGPDGLYSPVLDLTSLSDGLITATATQTDAAGNVSAAGSTTATKDTVPPAVPAVSIPAYVGLATYQAVTLTVSGEVGARLSYTLVDSTGWPLTDVLIVPTTGSYGVVLNLASFVDGPATLTVSLMDAAGNTTTAQTTVTKMTGIPPAPRVAIDPRDDSGEPISYYVTNVKAPRFIVTGNGTPTVYVNGVLYTGQALGDGIYTITATVTDPAGNVSPLGTAPHTLMVDTMSPTGTLAITTGTVINGQRATTSPSIALQLAFTDSASGLYQMALSTDGGTTYAAATPYAASATVTLGADGLYTIAVRVTDVARNSRIVTQTIRLDRAGPTISAALPAPTNNGSYDVGAKLTLTYSATDPDAISSLNVVLDSSITLVNGVIDIDLLNAGSHTIVVTSTDGLGNVSSMTITFQIHATVNGLIKAVNDGAARGYITANEQANLNWFLSKAVAPQTKQRLSQFISEANYQSGKAINATYAAHLVNWAQDLYNRS